MAFCLVLLVFWYISGSALIVSTHKWCSLQLHQGSSWCHDYFNLGKLLCREHRIFFEKMYYGN
ncbi:hypothetical protein KC19_VG220000 [Ceratodon purpureus]|uniref:Secreted protein n=1 Tax=Ceratodon purpureus TaxID=3225 RepID=A0A8T0HTQ8_CERPU|nr:hypothetical protein KC19_VG220000 [Ceratodon purpureus]